jgi:hypothetical protein
VPDCSGEADEVVPVEVVDVGEGTVPVVPVPGDVADAAGAGGVGADGPCVGAWVRSQAAAPSSATAMARKVAGFMIAVRR